MIGRKDEATTDGGLSLSQCQTCDRSTFVSIKPGLVSGYQPAGWLFHSPCACALMLVVYVRMCVAPVLIRCSIYLRRLLLFTTHKVKVKRVKGNENQLFVGVVLRWRCINSKAHAGKILPLSLNRDLSDCRLWTYKKYVREDFGKSHILESIPVAVCYIFNF